MYAIRPLATDPCRAWSFHQPSRSIPTGKLGNPATSLCTLAALNAPLRSAQLEMIPRVSKRTTGRIFECKSLLSFYTLDMWHLQPYRKVSPTPRLARDRQVPGTIYPSPIKNGQSAARSGVASPYICSAWAGYSAVKNILTDLQTFLRSSGKTGTADFPYSKPHLV
ncbi:hypothetical protein BDV96DRAFT_140287 [Lophiotrema nucula]|uniref:Uncharacterized protein n=1 Tax=Lophiotrema nucula TaxID=690887 RepID=A0A6A5ZVD3_9PLEO|nr:hypothetical protein BDV96DRAFT_140287 [Lophiotrema nucula]